MEFILNDSFRKLGIEHVVIGIARNVSTSAPLSDEFMKVFTEKEKEILELDESTLKDNGEGLFNTIYVVPKFSFFLIQFVYIFPTNLFLLYKILIF